MGDTSTDKPLTYFPAPDLFFELAGIDKDKLQSGAEVQIDGGLLKLLIATALSKFKVDESSYADRYADIEQAKNAGAINNLSSHYCQTGFFEGRIALPEAFDEDWYVANYPDVRLALESGEVERASTHFVEVGYREWRAPCDEARSEVAVWRKTLLT